MSKPKKLPKSIVQLAASEQIAALSQREFARLAVTIIVGDQNSVFVVREDNASGFSSLSLSMLGVVGVQYAASFDFGISHVAIVPDAVDLKSPKRKHFPQLT